VDLTQDLPRIGGARHPECDPEANAGRRPAAAGKAFILHQRFCAASERPAFAPPAARRLDGVGWADVR